MNILISSLGLMLFCILVLFVIPCVAVPGSLMVGDVDVMTVLATLQENIITLQSTVASQTDDILALENAIVTSHNSSYIKDQLITSMENKIEILESCMVMEICPAKPIWTYEPTTDPEIICDYYAFSNYTENPTDLTCEFDFAATDPSGHEPLNYSIILDSSAVSFHSGLNFNSSTGFLSGLVNETFASIPNSNLAFTVRATNTKGLYSERSAMIKTNNTIMASPPTTWTDGTLQFSVHNLAKNTLFQADSGKYYLEVNIDTPTAPVMFGSTSMAPVPWTSIAHLSLSYAGVFGCWFNIDDGFLDIYELAVGTNLQEVFRTRIGINAGVMQGFRAGFNSGLSNHKYITLNAGQQPFVGKIPWGYYGGFGTMPPN